MPSRRRLTTDARRSEILEVGARLFAERSYDDVRMDEVAERAGVSRALLYRYYSGKRDLFAGVYQQAAERLLDVTELTREGSLTEQIVAGLEAHIDYFVAHGNIVLAANRTLAGDPVIQAIITDELDVLRRRLLDASGLSGSDREVVSTLVMSWLVYVRVLCVEWLADPVFDRTTLRDVCTGALIGALGSVPGLDLSRFA